MKIVREGEITHGLCLPVQVQAVILLLHEILKMEPGHIIWDVNTMMSYKKEEIY